MKSFKRSFYLVLFTILVLVVFACGNPLENSSTDGISFTPQPLGMDYCYTCHNVPGSGQASEQVFEEWLSSRHANFSVGYFPPVDPFTMRDTFGVPRAYDEITGGPSLPGPSYLAGCMPCHNGEVVTGDVGGAILDTLIYGPLFTNPILGEIARPIIDCEACHISGAGHFGGATPPEVAIPAFNECTACHPPTPNLLTSDPFADAAYTDHHGPSSTHLWAYGGTVVDDLLNFGDPSPIGGTTLTVASVSFDAYIISATWLAANGGTWFFDGHETVNDTHYQGIWITDVENEMVVYETPTSKFGYVDLTNTSPNSGMVRADSVDSCTASCHGAHEFDLTTNEQWFEGAHHPNIEGPLGTTTSRGQVVVDVPGPANWGAVDHGYDEGCVRCHTSMGFAEVAPGYGDAVQTPGGESDGFITCNACHDGVNYPSSGNKRMRFTGSVALFDYNGDPLTYVDAGNSAVCVYCHQGLEDASHVAADSAAYDASNMAFYATSPKGNPATFRNMHYLAAGAMLFAEKGYEYAGASYSQEHIHTLVGCVGCHMADEPGTEEVGGHTFHMTDGAVESTSFCLGTCHPNMTAINFPWNATFDAESDIAYMLSALMNAIIVYDSPDDDPDTAANIKYQSWYPYFQPNSGQAWDPVAAKAAFNWQFVNKDPGAYAHNRSYALQLLWDSYEDLYNKDNSISPAPGSLSVTRP